MNLEHAVLLPGAANISTSAGAWNRHCAHKQGKEVGYDANLLRMMNKVAE